MLRVTLKSLLARKLRLLLSATAVVLGVSFVSGALTLTDTLGRVFDDLFAGVHAKTAVEVRGAPVFSGSASERTPVPAGLLPGVQAVEGVARVVGDVSGYAQLLNKDGTAYSPGGAPAFGINYDADPQTSSITLYSGTAPDSADELALDVGTAAKTGYRPGDGVTVQLVSGPRRFTLSGTFGFAGSDSVGGASIVALRDVAAQRLLGRPGEYDVLRVAGRPGVDPTVLLERVRAALPTGLEAVTGAQSADETAGEIKDALGFFNTFLLVFVAVALFVGAFLIFNTFSILVAQRQRELALLRALGASSGQVTRSVLVEALVLGVVASVLGLGLGVGVALLLRVVIDSFGGTLPRGPLVITPRTVVASFVVGVVVTAVAALVPARKASAVPPVAAMRDAAAPEASLRRGSLVGSVLLALGVVGVGIGLTGRLALLGAGALLSFLGVAALSPLLSRPAARLLGAPLARNLSGRLGRLNAMRNPRRTAATAAALMVGLALVSAVSVLGASTKSSVVRIVQGALGAELVVQQQGGFDGISPQVRQALDALPETGVVDALRLDRAEIAGDVVDVTAVPAGAVGATITLRRVAGDVEHLSPTTVLLGETAAADLGLKPGAALRVRLARGGDRDFTVAGTYADNRLVCAYLFDLAVAADFAQRLDGVLLVDPAPGTSSQQLRSAVDRATAAFPTVLVQDRQQFTQASTEQIDTVTAMISVLLLLSILIAVLGIVNTLALAVLERTRELGLLRAVGLSRRQTRRMVTVEAVIVAVFGALLGIVVGSAFGVAVQRALAGQGITELSFPFGRLALFVVVAGLAGVAAALLPARRAARLDVLRAIATT